MSADERPRRRDREGRRGLRGIGRQRLAEALENIYTPKDPGTRVPGREDLYDLARARIGDAPIVYLEFGVKGGRSLARIAERFTHPGARFYGFDSFEGLPEAWWNQDAGMFSTGGKMPGTKDKRVAFVKGWFQNALPEFLAAHDLAAGGPLLVHYDADLYGSTLFVMAQLWERTREYHFIFDEFLQDEAVALYDFSRAFPVAFEFYAQTETTLFKQVFGHMRRVAFEPAAPLQAAVPE